MRLGGLGDRKTKPTIFIVDDLKSCHMVLKIALGKMGCRFVTETRKETAIVRLPKVRPRIVITDLTPDGADAFDLIKAVKAYDKQIVVIVVSGTLTRQTAARALRLGASHCFQKPFDVINLREAIEEELV